MPDHPEIDILSVLLEDDVKEDSNSKSVLQLERERKKKDRIKRKMLMASLPTKCAAPCTRLVSKRPASDGLLEKTFN